MRKLKITLKLKTDFIDNTEKSSARSGAFLFRAELIPVFLRPILPSAGLL